MPATVHLDIQPSEVAETTTARSLGQEKVGSEILILPGSPRHPTLTSCFSTFLQSGASEPPSQLKAQVDPAAAVTSFHSQDPAIQPISEESFRQEYVVPRKAAFRGQKDEEDTSDEKDHELWVTETKTSQQNQAENVTKRGAHLGAKCIVFRGRPRHLEHRGDQCRSARS